MLLSYVDESYDKTHYWIVALLVPDSDAIPLTADLDAAVDKAATAYDSVSKSAELHGHALFHGKDDWEPVRLLPRARIGVYRDAFAAIAKYDVDVIIRGVHIPRLNERYAFPDHPHAVVLQHLLERVDERAASQDQLALVIADEIDGADGYRKNLWHFQRYATTGYRARKLKRIVDTIHFAPSEASRLVQAADLIAYLHYRINSTAKRDEREQRANAALWAVIEPKVCHCHCWFP